MTTKPANDNEPTSKLAEQLTALMAYRNRPEAPPEPLQSNWATDPHNAVEPEVRRTLFVEQRLEITPSIAQIEREMEKPVVRDGDGRTVSIGRLGFADGVQTEKGLAIGPDGDVIRKDLRMPRGAMLNCSERLTVSSGSAQAPNKVTLSNARLAEVFGVVPREYKPGTRDRRKGKALTAEESKVNLAAAIANTPVMPPVTICPPGLPNGTAQVSDCFNGMKIASTGKSVAIHWVDMFTAGREHEEWVAAEGDLSAGDKEVLDVAMGARSFAEVGLAAGQTLNYAKYNGGGKRALLAANDNYQAALRNRRA